MISSEKFPLTMMASLCLALVWPTLLVAQVAPPARPAAHFARPLSPTSVGLAVEQITFSFASGRAPDTNWGNLSVDVQRWRQAAGLRTGYLNVFLYDGSGAPVPVIHNLLVPPPDDCHDQRAGLLQSGSSAVRQQFASLPSSFLTPPARRLSTYFDLRPNTRGSGRLAGARLALVASRYPFPVSDPVFQVGLVLRPATVRVTPLVVNAEGSLLVEDGDPLPPPPGVSLDLVGPPPQPPVYPPYDPGPGPGDIAFPIEVFQADSPNVHCAWNQCLPMAMANMLGYLEERYNAMPLVWNLPHDHVFGFGRLVVSGDVLGWVPTPVNSLVAQIDAYTRRTGTFSANQGSGTDTLCQLYVALLRYFNDHGQAAKVEFRHQGSSAALIGLGEACDDGSGDLANIVSVREGLFPTWEWIFEQLQKGRAVGMLFGRYDSDGNRTSGHMVRVWGAARYNNLDYLYTLDDSSQGVNNSGLRTEIWEVADTGSPGAPGVPDGRLNLSGSTWEIEFVNSVAAKPTMLFLSP